MVFVDATKYLKVQDEDLEDAFDDTAAHKDDKYSKASFESFQIAPTDLPSSREPFHWPQWLTNLKFPQCNSMLAFIVPTILVILVMLTIALVITFTSDPDSETPEAEDQEQNETDIMFLAAGEIARRTTSSVSRRIAKHFQA